MADLEGNNEVRREVLHQEKIMADSEETVVVSEKNLKILHQNRGNSGGFRGSLVKN
jgi:hypothetical protein